MYYRWLWLLLSSGQIVDLPTMNSGVKLRNERPQKMHHCTMAFEVPENDGTPSPPTAVGKKSPVGEAPPKLGYPVPVANCWAEPRYCWPPPV
jgi:hypothetical protein